MGETTERTQLDRQSRRPIRFNDMNKKHTRPRSKDMKTIKEEENKSKANLSKPQLNRISQGKSTQNQKHKVNKKHQKLK